MSRRNSRHGKARRRAERDRRQVTERGPTRPGNLEQDPPAAGNQAAPRPGGRGLRDSEEHGSELSSGVGGGLIGMDPGEASLGAGAALENADPGDFGDLDPDDADLQAVLAEEELDQTGPGDAGDLAGDIDGQEGPDGPGYPEASQPGQPSAGVEAAGQGGAAARAVKLTADREDEEIFVIGGDDDHLPVAQAAVAGATADAVKDYLKQI